MSKGYGNERFIEVRKGQKEQVDVAPAKSLLRDEAKSLPMEDGSEPQELDHVTNEEVLGMLLH